MANYDASINNESNRSSRIYKDLDLDFGRNTVTSDVNKLTDVEAVKRSVRNLINLNHFDKPFHPEIGSNIRALLFENMTPLTSLNLQRQIGNVLANYEPRARISQILVRDLIDQNRYHVRKSFYVVGTPDPVTVETFLERLR